ncbi:hypothetical protein [Actinoallomurus sp. NPDC052274]|uniref:hypothetical protein n=1 Tax=Actinoallomurus sp. NPDC052274 TaxID=3155420 RepID=UPI00342A565F
MIVLVAIQPARGERVAGVGRAMVAADGRGGVPSAPPPPYSSSMNLDALKLINTPDDLPANLDEVPDDAYITTTVFAHLAEIKPESFRSMKVRSDKNHREGTSRPGDIPFTDEKIGNSPVWPMGVYRTWMKNRPGKGVGGGRPVGTKVAKKPQPPKRLELPAKCPHCDHEITGEDVLRQKQAAEAQA